MSDAALNKELCECPALYLCVRLYQLSVLLYLLHLLHVCDMGNIYSGFLLPRDVRDITNSSGEI